MIARKSNTDQLYFAGLIQLLEVSSLQEVNNLLNEGLEIVKIIDNQVGRVTDKGKVIYDTKPVFLMGAFNHEIKGVQPPNTPAKTPTPQPKPAETTTPSHNCYRCNQPIRIKSRGQNKGYDMLNLDGGTHTC